MILDTNALSDFIDGNPDAIALIASQTHIAIPVIVAGEYRFGILQSRYKSRMEALFEQFLQTCSILKIDIATTKHYAAIRLDLARAGNPIPANDVWIAALCRQHSMRVMSRDRHFDHVNGVARSAW